VSPTEQYSQRLSEWEARLAHFDRLHAGIGNIRLALAAAFLIMVWLCFGPAGAAQPWLLIPGAAFIAAVLYHLRVRGSRSRARRAAALYRAGLGRIRGQWSGNGPTGERFDVHHHIYGSDLDLFGADSLFELLCAARTPMGEETLARWLLAPAGIDAIRERQAAIADLRDRIDLREDLALQGESARIELRADMLMAWAQAPNRLDRAWIRWTAPLLAALAIAAALAWAITGLGSPFFAVLAAEAALGYFLREPTRAAIVSVETAYEDLKSLSRLLNRIESERFNAPPLRTLLIKLSSDGSIFFSQERVGLNKRRFAIFKFRTMVPNAEKMLAELEEHNEVSGPVFKIKKDPRITPIGRILRRTSVDELPQLFNVLEGDMSLVGPRPLPVRDYEGFNEDWQRRRFSVRPGITCLWQVSGRNAIPFEQWMKMDLQYMDEWSLWLDVKILAQTVSAVLKGSGAS